MNIQIRYRFSYSYPCLPLRSSNCGWHGNWFYIRDDAAAPLGARASSSPDALTAEAEAHAAYWSQRLLV
jgi:hypothetical protein